MQITTRTEYSVRALCELCFSQTALSLKTLAIEHKLPFKYLEHLFRQLKKSGIVYSTLGAQGGYRLNKSPEEISLLDIIKAVERRTAISSCFHNAESQYCLGENCRFRMIWGNINNHLEEHYKNITLATIIEQI